MNATFSNTATRRKPAQQKPARGQGRSSAFSFAQQSRLYISQIAVESPRPVFPSPVLAIGTGVTCRALRDLAMPVQLVAMACALAFLPLSFGFSLTFDEHCAVVEGVFIVPVSETGKVDSGRGRVGGGACDGGGATAARSVHPVGNTGYTSPKREDAPKTVPSLNVGGFDRG